MSARRPDEEPVVLDPGLTAFTLYARARQRARLGGCYPYIERRDVLAAGVLAVTVALVSLAVYLLAFDWRW
jgi:hypothetical protein